MKHVKITFNFLLKNGADRDVKIDANLMLQLF